MELFPSDIFAALLANGERHRRAIENPGDLSALQHAIALRPVVRIVMKEPRRVWLLSAVDPAYPDCAFGLIDTGAGSAIYGFVYLETFAHCRQALGLAIERDESFVADRSLQEYAIGAYLSGRLDGPEIPPGTGIPAPVTRDAARATAVHVIHTQDEIARMAEQRASQARLDKYLADCERERGED